MDNNGTSFAKQAAGFAARKLLTSAGKTIVLKFCLPLLAILLALSVLFMGISLTLGTFFTPMDGQNGLFNFTSDPATENNVAVNLALLNQYKAASAATVDAQTQQEVPMTTNYLVPWGYFAAIDKITNNCEKPAPNDYINGLKPIFTFIEMPKTVTVCGDKGCSTTVTQIKLIDTANTYNGIYTHKYKMVTTQSGSTTITEPVLEQVIPPIPPDYTRLLSVLSDYKITDNYDRKLVLMMAQNYTNGGGVDLNQPVDLSDIIMAGVSGGITYSVCPPPPANLVPYFEQSAERFHGETDVHEFEALLIAICFSESSFKNTSDIVSTTGALGPMQFEPGTWAHYGGELWYSASDVWDFQKAIMAAGLMLADDGAADGTMAGIRNALRRYGGDNTYVDLYVGRMYFYGSYTGWTEKNPQGFTWPLPGHTQITDPFGMRTNPVTGQSGDFHTGADIAAPLGTPILAAKDGTVISVVRGDPIYGTNITIDHGNGEVSFYGHMSQSYVSVGQHVTAGEPIAPVGSEGRSTGPHLHFEIRLNGIPTNPLTIDPPPGS